MKHIQLYASIQYKKKRNEFIYTVLMNIYKTENNGIDPTLTKKSYSYTGEISDCHSFIENQWVELSNNIKDDYADSKFCNRREFKNYRGLKVLSNLCTYNLIKSNDQ